MKKFNKKLVIGTRVEIEGYPKWYTVKQVYNHHKLIKVEGLGGFFQEGHITSYTNK